MVALAASTRACWLARCTSCTGGVARGAQHAAHSAEKSPCAVSLRRSARRSLRATRAISDLLWSGRLLLLPSLAGGDHRAAKTVPSTRFVVHVRSYIFSLNLHSRSDRLVTVPSSSVRQRKKERTWYPWSQGFQVKNWLTLDVSFRCSRLRRACQDKALSCRILLSQWRPIYQLPDPTSFR